MRGRKRPGAGRPPGSSTRPATITMRVPEEAAEIVWAYSEKHEVPATVGIERLVKAGAGSLRRKKP